MIAGVDLGLWGIPPWILVSLGFFVGVLGGFFGVGGTWIVTPGLNLLGLPIAYAVGTDLLHTMGKSIVATIKHRKFGHVDVKLGVFMIVGTAIGLELGKELLLDLESRGVAEWSIRMVYIALLFFIATFVITDYYRRSVKHRVPPPDRPRLYQRAQALRLPPYMSFPASGIARISIWIPFGISLATGFVSGLLGVGAGFIRMPSLVYIIGVPTKLAVGTDLFEIIFSAGIGAFLYAMEDRVILGVAAVMLVGAAVGAQIGTLATRFVKGMRIRLYFGISVLIPAIALSVKQFGDMLGIPNVDGVAVTMLMGSALFIALVILRALVRGILEDRTSRRLDESAGAALASLTTEPDSPGGKKP